MKNEPTPAPTQGPLAIRPVSIYTDGACSGNPGPGGCAGVLLLPEGVHEFSFHETPTTNNRMEIRAAIEALNLLPEHDVVVHTDSMYMINAVTTWIAGWRRNGWRKRDGAPVLNRDLWEQLLDAIRRHRSVTWRHVKGHAGDHYNELADELARGAARGREVAYGPSAGRSRSGRSASVNSVRF